MRSLKHIWVSNHESGQMQSPVEFERPGSEKYVCPRRRNHYRHRHEKPKTSRKFRWHDGQGRQLTAGGLLPYDGRGIWLIGEKERDGTVEWTDMGGRYEFEDGDIFKTIAREVGEELYHSAELLRRDVLRFSRLYPPVYVNGHQKMPVYICYPVPVAELLKRNFILDPIAFDEHREEVLKANPTVPSNYYSSVILRYFPYPILHDALEGKLKKPVLKFRLRSILKKFLPRIEKTEKYHASRVGEKPNELLRTRPPGLPRPQEGPQPRRM